MAAVTTMGSAESCVICWLGTPIGEGLGHAAGAADHVFHKACLERWFQSNHSCPTCRALITSVNGVPLPQLPDEAEREFERLRENVGATIIQNLQQNGLIPRDFVARSTRHAPPLRPGMSIVITATTETWVLHGRPIEATRTTRERNPFPTYPDLLCCAIL